MLSRLSHPGEGIGARAASALSFLLDMRKANVELGYVRHRGEEECTGGRSLDWTVANSPFLVGSVPINWLCLAPPHRKGQNLERDPQAASTDPGPLEILESN